MRLIDADDAQKELIDAVDWLREEDYETYSAIGDNIAFVLSKQPIAYDVDNVVEQLEELKEEKEIGSHKVTVKEAIEIVKRGGIDE